MENQGIYEPLRWMFEEARANGLWFFSSYQKLWFSPDELEEANCKGRFRWGPVSWVLRNPRERIAELVEEHEETHKKIESIRQKVGEGNV